MAKAKVAYVCRDCGAVNPKWMGQCADCQGWNTLVEETVSIRKKDPALAGYSGDESAQVLALDAITLETSERRDTGFAEFNRVLGGGLVPGSVVLIGGDPGIGKSTLILQAVSKLAGAQKALYVTGEESLQQIALRGKRLNLRLAQIDALAETNIERIIELAKQTMPQVMVIDSIQTVYTEYLSSAPGSVSQVRESAARLVRFAKIQQIALFIIGHVTKEGALAGPRVLEHMVDTVLYFEGEKDSRYRLLRAIKNRYGAVNELGLFAMMETGLHEVKNPSAIFLTRDQNPVSGSAVSVIWEGSRPLLLEVQALVDHSPMNNARRVSVGIDSHRLSLLLAVLHRHGGIAAYDQDVYVNIVGGIRVTETATDLACLLAILSSLRDKPLPYDWVFFGEIGLAGEIRPVTRGVERLQEAHKHGFKQAVVAAGNQPKPAMSGIEIHPVKLLSEVLSLLQ